MSFATSPFATIAAPTLSRPAPRSFFGWAFQRIAALDLNGPPGLLAEIASRSTLVRQAVFAAVSRLDHENSSAFANRLNAANVGEALRRWRARELIAQPLRSNAPRGPRALA